MYCEFFVIDVMLIVNYELLWEEINREDVSNITLLNNLRRILESYLNFVGKHDNVWECLEEIDESDPKFYLYSALLSQIHEGSHKVRINDEMYYSKIKNENRETIMEVFESLFKDIGEEHYNLMMEKYKN